MTVSTYRVKSLPSLAEYSRAGDRGAGGNPRAPSIPHRCPVRHEVPFGFRLVRVRERSATDNLRPWMLEPNYARPARTEPRPQGRRAMPQLRQSSASQPTPRRNRQSHASLRPKLTAPALPGTTKTPQPSHFVPFDTTPGSNRAVSEVMGASRKPLPDPGEPEPNGFLCRTGRDAEPRGARGLPPRLCPGSRIFCQVVQKSCA